MRISTDTQAGGEHLGSATLRYDGRFKEAGLDPRGHSAGRGLQPESPRPHGGLALHPPVRGQRRCHRPDARGLRAGDPVAVPGRSGTSDGPSRRRRVMSATPTTPPATTSPTPSKSWTVKVRERGVEALPPERLLPDGQPTYVASWIYVFGVASIASLIVIIGSGCILSLKGPAWWHYTGIGHFFNSIHMWAVKLFFFVMVVHLWGKYWMSAWRGGRTRVWITGAITFIVAVPTALTGYVSQQNFDAQWISTQAKDGLNAVGVGAFFNVTNFGQMYSYHVLLLPIAVVALVSAHVLLVRRNGVVPPFEIDSKKAAIAEASPDRGGSPAPPPSTSTGAQS